MAKAVFRRTLCLSAASLIVLASCTKPPSSKEEEMMNKLVQEKQILPASAEERAAIKHHDMITQAKFWGDQFELNPTDHEAAIEFSAALRAIGSSERAVDIATQALALHPGDVALSKTLAKAQMDIGRPDRATTALYNARPDSDDWSLYSLYGVALDQLGDHEKAQLRYKKALELSPNNQVVLANFALSLMLEGKPETAETKLRQAIETNEFVDPRVRQNLVLVLGVQGRFDEASELASIDLPPSMAEASIDYYKKLLTPPARDWNALRRSQDVED